MNEPKMCCNCLHCARWKRKNGIECHCDLTDKYLGYLDVFDEDRNCKHWEKETKWDLQKKHDSELLDKVLERVKEHHYLLSDKINSTDYGMFTVGIEQVIAEMKAGIEEKNDKRTESN